MALDPRIALQGIGFQAPDILGAVRQGQDIRRNNMTMRAEEAAAQRNAMVRGRSAKVDYRDPNAVNKFVQFAGPDATPYLAAASAGQGLATAQGTAAREQSKFDRDTADRDLRLVVGRVFSDPSDANLADAAQRYPQFAPDIGRIAQMPVEARSAALASLVAALPGGDGFLSSMTQEYKDINLGGTVARVPTRPYLPGEREELTVTPSPNRPQLDLVQREDGSFTIIDLGTGDATDTGVVGRVPGSGAGGQDPDRTAGAAAGLRDTIDSLRGYYTDLDEARGIVSTERGPMDNLVASAGASLPGRVLGRTFGSREQTLRDNIRTAIPMVVASLKDLTGMSAQQMNSNVELQLFLGTVGDPSQSIETVMEALDRFERYVGAVAEGRTSATPAADPLEGRTATGPGGQRLVRRNGQWVPAQ